MTPLQSNSAPMLIRLWFLVNAVVLLLPPLHWWVSGHQGAILGLPATLFYFIALSVSITFSVITAYVQETASGELE